MTAESGSKLLFVGDSHTHALLSGARSLGIPADGVSWSGNGWHNGQFAITKDGIEPRRLPNATKALNEMRGRLADDKSTDKQTVVSTIGFHLGRLVPPFGWNGHEAYTRASGGSDGKETVSRSFLREYILSYRARHIRVARKYAKQVNLVIVAPPTTFSRPSYAAFKEELIDQFTRAKLCIFDPAVEFKKDGGVVPPALLESDQLHGNSEYGERVILAMVRDGVLDITVPKMATH